MKHLLFNDYYPNSDIESQFRGQIIDVHKEFTKTKYSSLVMKLFEDFRYIPNPDIESQFRVQVIDVHKEFTKTKYTSLVMKLFEDFLGALRACALIVIFYIGIWVYS